jgi:hypothetical protein
MGTGPVCLWKNNQGESGVPVRFVCAKTIRVNLGFRVNFCVNV